MSENIVLIGYMGCGKSSVGAQLSRLSGRFLLDTDLIIESSLNKSVCEIFSESGEQFFRNTESKLASWISQSVSGAIIATGGGMPIFTDISKMGKIFYLKMDFERIISRLDSEEIASRPLLQDLQKARELFNKRAAIYETIADFVINADDEYQNVAQAILHTLKQ